MTTKTYDNADITVTWKPDLCIHSEICYRGLDAVFDPNRRPWIDMGGAETDRITVQVGKCPSGALSWAAKTESAGPQPAPAAEAGAALTIEVTADGPLLVKSAHQLDLADGTAKQRSGTTAYCRCGASARKPFCDGSHKRVGFKG